MGQFYRVEQIRSVHRGQNGANYSKIISLKVSSSRLSQGVLRRYQSVRGEAHGIKCRKARDEHFHQGLIGTVGP